MRYFPLFALIFLCFGVAAQRIQNFQLFQVNKTVSIKFTLTPGATCYGFKVLHSLDSINYTEAVNYPGTCGGSGADEQMSEVDQNPALNAFNYYKVQLSTFETSDIRRIYVSSSAQKNLQVIPNPIYNFNDQVHVRVFNTDNQRFLGFIYDQFGHLHQKFDLQGVKDVADFDVSFLQNGLFVLWLTDGTQIYGGKFIISR
jgi:hypothetical protein